MHTRPRPSGHALASLLALAALGLAACGGGDGKDDAAADAAADAPADAGGNDRGDVATGDVGGDTGDAPAGDVTDGGSEGGGSDGAGGDGGGDAAGDAGDAAKDMTVHGRVLYLYFDAPVPTARVDLGGTSTYAITDADGAFTLPDVPDSYDLTVSYTVNGYAITDRYVGLGTRTPLLEGPVQDTSAVSKAMLSGTVTGVTSPVPTGEAVRVIARSRGGTVAFQTLTAGMTTDFSITPEWTGPTMRPVTIHALHYTIPPAGGYATAYHAAGELGVMAKDGEPQTDLVVAASAIGGKAATGTFTPPDTKANLYMNIVFGTRETDGYITFNAGSTSPFSVLTPAMTGATIFLGYVANFPEGGIGGRRVVVADEPLDFVLPEEATADAPDDAAAFTPEMSFSWNAPAAPTGVYRFTLAPKSGSGPAYATTTAGTSVTLPPSFVPTAATPYVWTVRYFLDAATVDALATDRGWSFEGSIRTANRNLDVP